MSKSSDRHVKYRKIHMPRNYLLIPCNHLIHPLLPGPPHSVGHHRSPCTPPSTTTLDDQPSSDPEVYDAPWQIPLIQATSSAPSIVVQSKPKPSPTRPPGQPPQCSSAVSVSIQLQRSDSPAGQYEWPFSQIDVSPMTCWSSSLLFLRLKPPLPKGLNARSSWDKEKSIASVCKEELT